jgi:hypothetical protein
MVSGNEVAFLQDVVRRPKGCTALELPVPLLSSVGAEAEHLLEFYPPTENFLKGPELQR